VDFLMQRGLKPVVVLLDASTFGGKQTADPLLGSIKLLGIPHRVVKCDVDLSMALSAD